MAARALLAQWGSPTADEFRNYPVLTRHLDWIKLWPRGGSYQWPDGIDWILFRARVDVFDRNTMPNPLKELIADKTSRYASSGMGFDDVSLLLFYNLAAIYNSPADTPLHPLEGFVEDAKQVITDSAGPFNRVFLYMALVPGKVYQLR
jgi:hypothetical protein